MNNNTAPTKKLAAPKVVTSVRAGAGAKAAYNPHYYPNHNQTRRVKRPVK